MKAVGQFGQVVQAFSLAVILLSDAAWAQDPGAQIGQGGNWDLSLWTAGATGEETRNSFAQAQLWSAGVFVGRMVTGEMGSGWRRGSVEYGVAAIPVFIQLNPQRVHGAGFEPAVVRWNSGYRIGRALSFIELAGGGVATNANLPPGKTSSFNFTARGGGGISLFTGRRQSLDLGCRYYHVSNANLGVRNPEFNGVQVSLGYHWFK